jgi:hypothetical protein
MPVKTNRPRPIKVAAGQLSKALGGMLAFATATGGVTTYLSAVQDVPPALTAVLSSLPGWAGVLMLALYAFGIVNRTEPLVTPLEDPAVKTESGRLVALAPVSRDLS